MEHIIDCDAEPFVPDGWSLRIHRKGGQFKFDPDQVNLYLSPKQEGEEFINGNDLFKELLPRAVLNANVLDYLLAHPYLIPESWKRDEQGRPRYIFFWGTIYRSAMGFDCVRLLCWYDGRWDWYCDGINGNYRVNFPAALPVFRLRMGGPETTDQITAGLGFPFDPKITQTNFPLNASESPRQDEIEIIDPEWLGEEPTFSEEEGLKLLADARLDPPTYEHGIRFAQQYGKTITSTEKPFVYFLQESLQDPEGHHCVLVLIRDGENNMLYLGFPENGFDYDDCVLAAVRRRQH
jgi:hypothetical protein